jgi:DNA-directed RNA polymerase subunit RPC12/RpoP
MSETTREMLVRGIAAAKTNRPEDKAEAQHYLEWVLRSDEADLAHKATAWLWLSQVEDDAAKKRECLENVLAIDPANALARRGLAVLDGRMKPDDVIDPNKPATPVTPQPVAVRRYACPKCGGKMTYDVKARAVTCEYCGHHLTEYQAITHGALVHEQDFLTTLPTAKAHRWELAATHVSNCQGCGAAFAVPPGRTSGACPFCGSTHVVETMPTGELIQPEGIVPFQFDAEAALAHVRNWIDAQKFRPDDLDERAAIARPRGVYLPVWTFDLGGQINWSAQIEVQHGRYSTWEPRNDIYLVYHNDLLVPASHSLPKTLIDPIAGFDTRALAPYSLDLLADWPAEIYQITLADASLVARERALHTARHSVEHQSLAGEQYRDLRLNSIGLIVETYKLALLPVWLTSYRYKDRSYAVAVNGQTGAVAGDVPRGGWQKMLAGLFGEA